MHYQTDDLRIKNIKPLIPPAILMEEIKLSEKAESTVNQGRKSIESIMHGQDSRLVVIVGPCSIHDPKAALEYAALLSNMREQLADSLEIVMRVYFEKPRTRNGWKGLINDPFLDDSFQINKGLRLGRKVLTDICDMGLPVGCEFLDTISPQFTADCVSWGAIGARTTESQIHRELASGLSMPVGFKNGTDGNIKIAIDALHAARNPHHFLSVTKQGVAAIVETGGNDFCHVILRGAGAKSNYDAESVDAASKGLVEAGLNPRLMVDCSHGNSQKDHRKQIVVTESIAAQLEAGSQNIFGVMIESFLVEGNQSLRPGQPLTYGQSITDACVDWKTTVNMLHRLAEASQKRQQHVLN
jgi:3-deoxy-7-phosphoheptulonate synthase